MKVIGKIHENAFRTLGLKKPSLKLYKKPKAKAAKKPKSKMDEIIDKAKDPYHTQYGTYQSPCGTCTSSCAPGCSIAF